MDWKINYSNLVENWILTKVEALEIQKITLSSRAFNTLKAMVLFPQDWAKYRKSLAAHINTPENEIIAVSNNDSNNIPLTIEDDMAIRYWKVWEIIQGPWQEIPWTLEHDMNQRYFWDNN